MAHLKTEVTRKKLAKTISDFKRYGLTNLTKVFLTFSGVTEMELWAKMG